jgi:hypothetical protein
MPSARADRRVEWWTLADGRMRPMDIFRTRFSRKTSKVTTLSIVMNIND